jgi:hypothetical protein
MPADDRQRVLEELVRVASSLVIVVLPVSSRPEREDEEAFLSISEKLHVEPMPSLAEHVKFGLPTTDDIEMYRARYRGLVHYATSRDPYWAMQTAMLINTAAMGDDAERINRQLQEFQEKFLDDEDEELDRKDAYRAVLVIPVSPEISCS